MLLHIWREKISIIISEFGIFVIVSIVIHGIIVYCMGHEIVAAADIQNTYGTKTRNKGDQ